MTKKSNKKSLWFIIIIVICVIIILASLGVGTILIIQKLKSKTNKDKCSINCKNGNCDSNGKCICINKWSGEYCNIKPSPGPSPDPSPGPSPDPSPGPGPSKCTQLNCKNGKCEDGKCNCKQTWTGSSCNVKTNNYIYFEDAQSTGVYSDINQLLGFKTIVFDFTPHYYITIQTNLQNLIDNKYTGKIYFHPDTTAKNWGDVTNFEDLISNIKNKFVTHIGKKYVNYITGIVFEPESNKYKPNALKKYFNDIPQNLNNIKQTYITTLKKYFGQINDCNMWTTKPCNGIIDNNNIFIEVYNLYTKNVCGHACSDKSVSNCKVDYNPRCYNEDEKTYMSSFKDAKCGPSAANIKCTDIHKCKSKKGCGLCGTSTNACCGGGIYDKNSILTPSDRGKWIATVLQSQCTDPHARIKNDTKAILMFPFTNMSCPTLRNVIKNLDDFEKFINGFLDSYTLSIEKATHLQFGFWGRPTFIEIK